MVEADKRKVEFALLQEPYVGGISRMKGYRGARVYQNTEYGEGTVKAAIAVFNQDLDVIQCPELTTNNIAVVRIRTRAWQITAISFYFEPTQPIEPYLEQIKTIVDKIGQGRVIVGGDANAKSTWWGSNVIDDRGEELSGTLEELGLQVLNEGDMPTFDTIRGGVAYTGHPDITACSIDMLDLVDGWRVVDDLTSSDHNGITFNVALEKSKGMSVNRTTRLYNTKKANWSQFHEKLAQLKIEYNINKTEIEKLANKVELEQAIEKFTTVITQTCVDTIPKKKTKETLTMPWWSEELAVLKKKSNTLKRRIKGAAPARRPRVVEEYLEARERFINEVKIAQVQSWKAFCEKQDREGVWEGIYRVIGRTATRQEDIPLKKDGKQIDPKESAKTLANTFFPEDNEEEDDANHRQTREKASCVNDQVHNELHDPPFTIEELSAAVGSFNPKKAPGLDGFTADICSQAIGSDPETFLALANRCLALSHFPIIWKEATVVVLRKPGKEDYTNPKSYRPIGLLPVLGKVLEKMVIGRMKWHLIPKMSTRQYGFMPKKSTEDSLYDLIHHIQKKLNEKKLITMISLDIEGAFDSAWWPAIRVRLAEEGCPINVRRLIDSYLQDRRVSVRYAGEEHTKHTSKGCVQGSIGGPIMWNLLLDPLLKELEQRGDYVQAFADDVVLVFDGDTALEVQRQANAALAYVGEWGVRNKLGFAPHKTNAMVITRKLVHDTPLLRMGGVGIGMSQEFKILGLTIDNKLTFNSHATNVCKKALNVYKQLSRAAKVSWGLSPEVIRIIYTATIEPIIMYAASAWAPATKKKGIQKQLNAVQRGFAQKLTRAYRTVSLNSGLVLAGILPLDLRIQEAAALYEAKRGVPRPELKDREVERPTPYAQVKHPAEYTRLTFTSLMDQEQVDAHNTQAVQIYTDGSKIEGEVGAALSLWSGEAEIKAFKLKLPSYCTVYQAELLAICRATQEILKRSEGTFGIYSDSRSALQSVVNNGSLHPLAVEARENLSTSRLQNKEISLFWIKAHAGLERNERADQLAKEAAINKKRRLDYDYCPVSFVKRQIRLQSLDEWNRRYKQSTTASVTKLFFPDAVQAYRTIRKLETTSVVTQVLTGHGGFSEYLYRFKCKENPSCICEPGVDETVVHILLECPVFSLKRYEAEQVLNLKLTAENLNKIICNPDLRDVFTKYCTEIVSKVINRNK